MKRTLLTTAAVTALATSVLAETDTNVFLDQTFDSSFNINASDMIGMRVYASEASISNGMMVPAGGDTDWNDIGEINEIVLTRDGDVQSVIVGVGGFLGINEKDVAVDMSSIRFVEEEGETDDYFLVVEATTVGVQDAPAYEYDLSSNTLDNEIEPMADAENIDLAEAPDTADTRSGMESIVDPEMTDAMVADADNAEIIGVEPATDGDMVESAQATGPFEVMDGFERMDSEALTAETLTGITVYDANDEAVGEVDKLLLTANGEIDRAVIDVGGFLGLGEHSVAVDIDDLVILQQEDSSDVRVFINATQQALEAKPEYQG